ncbi:glutamate/aspartate transport system permease [Bordetella ansorpii]|uniref:Glutamate/aspartate import permease protein GltK n=1 Tax=Bordetella ansorpii TaxID=288768 RepID=A0A157QAQ0_9BORD|nr:ABC transporter permease subunit [Bordetella ansorpii]SAI42837.1 glutamate/aspartate transport system permease [Bordetella ansorpii]
MIPLHFDFLTAEVFHTMWTGMLITLRVSLVAVLAGILFGTVLALMRLGRWRPLRLFAKAYVNVFRALPLPMVLLGFYLVVPQLLQSLYWGAGSWDTRMASALVGFSLFEAAYYAEIIRAGIQSVPRGQYAAAASLGMRPRQAFALIVLPQAFRKMTPLLLTQFIVLFQDTALVFVISLSDFFTSSANIGQRDGRIAEMMLIAGAVYFVICFCASRLVGRMVRRKSA